MILLKSLSLPWMVKSLIGTLLLMLTFPAVATTIVGSAHDFSGSGFTTEICIVCHTPHDADISSNAPLWNHEISTATYILYSSPTLSIDPEQPSPGNLSRMCLSCHDGTVAIDSFGGGSGSTYISDQASIGTDLSNDHPVGILWTHSESNWCLNCHDLRNLLGQTGGGLRFYEGKVECPSCHDVHNKSVEDVKLLRKPLAGSQLCLHCHAK